MEYERYDEGLTYRYVYGVDKLGVTAYTIPNGSASVTTAEGTIPLYYHMDHMGSSEFLTSDVTQKVTSWTSYDEWGNITHNAVLKCGTRELDLVKTYTGHERDSVLGMYYAKARMYDTADKHGSSKGNKLGDKRFISVDPVKGNVRDPQSLVQYTYVLNNPLMYVDPLGEMNYLTQTGILLSATTAGAEQLLKEYIEGVKQIPQLPELTAELIGAILNEEIAIDELITAAIQDGLQDFVYLKNNAGVLSPWNKNTDAEVEKYGNALGRGLAQIVAMVGGTATGTGAAAALSATEKVLAKSPVLLQSIKNVKKIAKTTDNKKYNNKLNCDEIIKKEIKTELEVKNSFVLPRKNLEFHEQLLEDLKNAPVIKKEIGKTGVAMPYRKEVVYDGVKVMLRKDAGPFTHSNQPDHFNLEVWNEFGNLKFDRHIYVDDNGDIVKIVDYIPGTSKKKSTEILIYER